MSFRINGGTASLSAQRHLDKSQRMTEKALGQLASGSRIVRAGDDAAGFAISESLRAQLSGLKQAKSNANSALSLIQTAEGGLNEQNNILIRLRELSVQSASDTIGDTEREFLELEYTQLTEEFDRIAKTTKYGKKDLLTGSGESFEFHVGAFSGSENVVKFKLEANTTASEAEIDGLSVVDKDDAKDSLEALDSALVKIASARASFGAVQSRMQFTIDNLSVQSENISEARSLITDVDVAEAVTELTKGRILQDIGVQVLASANADSGRVLRLIG